MAKRKTVVPFHGTAEQEKALRELIAACKQQQGALMPVLQGAQELYGYLPIEVQTIIAEELNLPLAEVYGVVTFYAQFTLNPRGRYNIGVCMGTACYVKGAGEVLERIHELRGEIARFQESIVRARPRMDQAQAELDAMEARARKIGKKLM